MQMNHQIMIQKIKNVLKKIPFFVLLKKHIKSSRSLNIELIYQQRLKNCKNKFAAEFAQKYFSQTDEDGLTIEILKRIDTQTKQTFLEFGVGNGLENNTLILLSMGWKGSWYGGEDLAFNYQQSKRLNFQKRWINVNNIIDFYKESLNVNKVEQHQVISLDLDGNDLFFAKKILEAGGRPNLFICEYNAIFPPKVKWCMPYNTNHQWENDHYFGASLASFVALFQKHDYFLCACNPQTGANAFFVKSQYRDLFADVPNNVEDIYMTPFYELDNKFTHLVSPKFIESIVSR
tara:strand:+ start:110 stop:979 length:870 start_codon:yes stop_codon:yes gene_type:complete